MRIKFIAAIVMFIIVTGMITGCNEHLPHITPGDSANPEIIDVESPHSATLEPGMKIPVYTINKTDDVFEITSFEFFFSDIAEVYGYDYTDDRIVWNEFISRKFGIELKVISAYNDASAGLLPYNSTDINKYNELKKKVESGDYSGLLRLNDPGIVTLLIGDGLILPWDEFLTDNLNWQAMPAQVKRAYNIGGYTWGYPTRIIRKGLSRYYRSDWLENMNIGIPTNLDSFYETMIAFTFNDPDKDGLANTRGFEWTMSLNGLEDIFSAFDARMNYNGYLSPAYNPNTGLFEDSMQKSEVRECLEFLLGCVDQGIMEKAIIQDGLTSFERGTTGSFCSDVSRYEFADRSILNYRPDENPVIIATHTLTHNINERIYAYYSLYNSPYVLTVGSAHGYSTLNNFVDVFLADIDGYLAGKFGLAGQAYSLEGDTIVYKTSTHSGDNYAYRGPFITYDSPFHDLDTIQDYKFMSDINAPDITAVRLDEMKSDLGCYEISWNIIMMQNEGVTNYKMDILGSTSISLIQQVLEGYIDIDYALDEYIKLAKIYNVQEYIDEMNLRIENIN